MSQIRIYIDDAIYFVTTRTFDFQRLFAEDDNCRLFLEVLDFCHKKFKFKLYGFAVMPDHVHLLIEPNEKYNISEIIHRIKGNFAIKYHRQRNHKGSVAYRGGEPSWFAEHEPDKPSWFAKEKRYRIRIDPIWQKSFYDRIIRCDRHLDNVIHYIDNNAVHHQLVDDPIKWKYSSYHNHCETGQELISINYLS